MAASAMPIMKTTTSLTAKKTKLTFKHHRSTKKLEFFRVWWNELRLILICLPCSKVDAFIVSQSARKLVDRIAVIDFSTLTFLLLFILSQLVEHAHLIHEWIIEVTNNEKLMIIEVEVLIVCLLLSALVVNWAWQLDLNVFLRLRGWSKAFI